MWVPFLNLTMDDKGILLSDSWPNDRHIDAINTLVAKQIGSNAVQTTVMAQAQTGFDAVTEESFQVVYAASPWVAAACVDGQVMIANSLGDTLSPTLCKQLKQLYATLLSPTGHLTVNLVDCAQQPNLQDCGLRSPAGWVLRTVCSRISRR